MTPIRHPLIDRYLSELSAELAHLPLAEREEVIDGVRAHIDEAVSVGSSDAQVRDALGLLGEPREIAAAAMPEQQLERVPSGVFALLGTGLALVIVVFVPGLWFISVAVAVAAAVAARRAQSQARLAARPARLATVTLVAASTFAGALLRSFVLTLATRSTSSSPEGPPPTDVPGPTTTAP